MKRILGLVMAMAILTAPLGAFAAGSGPFDPGVCGCERFRIPALYTLADGSLLASADLRWDHGSDSPQNIDTAVARLTGDGWEPAIVNRFDDYADGVGSKQSASFIDSALLQAADGTVFLLTEAYSSGVGILNTAQGTGCVTIDGQPRIALAANGTQDYTFYIGDFADGFAPICRSGAATAYSVDEAYRIYQNGRLLTMAQRGADDAPTGAEIAQTVFYADAAFCVAAKPFLWLRSSKDGGRSWSAPQILNGMVMREEDYFLGVCPGRGCAVRVNGAERLIFTVYHSRAGGNEFAMTIYSEDGGVTWQRGEAVRHAPMLGKTSESQIVPLPDGTLRMFSRNKSNYVAFCDSADGGVTWSKAQPDPGLCGTQNCMVSFLNAGCEINGMPVILGSMGGSVSARADGVVRVGLLGEGNRIDWISTYHVNDGFFAYSCLTRLPDGGFGLLYEDAPAQISYMELDLRSDGTLTAREGKDLHFTKQPTLWERLRIFFMDLWLRLRAPFVK
ncbi:MAG: exo-alpha-sialidase [Clostridia bacterium]|nr:exo-alpha-sialidase [Clostridia bacterium]